MTRIRIAAALGVAAALVAVPAYAAQSATTVLGSVGPGFTISAKNTKNLKAGKVKLTVSDKSSSHNFRLKGPGVNVATSVGATGSKSFTVTLKKGTYTFLCDPHASSMRGSFKVG